MSDICHLTLQFTATNTFLRRWICTEVTLCSSETQMIRFTYSDDEVWREGRKRGEWDMIVRDSDWHVARRHWSVSWRTCCLTTLRVSGPGTLPVSGVGGLLTSVWMCVSRPSGLKPLLNTHPRNDTDTVPSGPPPSPDRVPGKHNLYLFAPPLRISLNLSALLLLALPLWLYHSLVEYNRSH